MTPTDAFVARANIIRMRLQIAVEADAAATAMLQGLLEEQLETLRAGEVVEASASRGQFEKP
jgi:hypothetical protein